MSSVQDVKVEFNKEKETMTKKDILKILGEENQQVKQWAPGKPSTETGSKKGQERDKVDVQTVRHI